MEFGDITNEPEQIQACARLIQHYSWGEDYPVSALEELRQAELVIGAFDHQDLVGCAMITRYGSPDGKDAGKLWFQGAVVHPDYRRQGIFTELYQRCLAYAKTRSGSLFLCGENPIAEKFYQKNGWHEVRQTKDESGEACRIYRYRFKQANA